MKDKLINEEGLENPEINLTPLIDVVFVILIMFIVVVPLLKVDRVELAGGGDKENKVQESVISLHVYKDNSLMLNGKILQLDDLKAKLSTEKRKHENAALTLFHDKSASFGTYQTIKEIAQSVGFQEMDVMLK